MVVQICRGCELASPSATQPTQVCTSKHPPHPRAHPPPQTAVMVKAGSFINIVAIKLQQREQGDACRCGAGEGEGVVHVLGVGRGRGADPRVCDASAAHAQNQCWSEVGCGSCRPHEFPLHLAPFLTHVLRCSCHTHHTRSCVGSRALAQCTGCQELWVTWSTSVTFLQIEIRTFLILSSGEKKGVKKRGYEDVFNG
jgi:hypothetical protein